MNESDLRFDLDFTSIKQYTTANLTNPINEFDSNGRIITTMPETKLNDYCYAEVDGRTIALQVRAVSGQKVTLEAINNEELLSEDLKITNPQNAQKISIPKNPLGTILNSHGEVLNDLKEIKTSSVKLNNESPNCLKRKAVNRQFFSRINIIDSLFSLGLGQRIGLFAPAGTGKSTLLGQIAKNSSADVNVIALVGERGREVNEFITQSLGEQGLKKSILVVATADESALARKNAGLLATAIAEKYRTEGKDVLLMFDSLTRYIRATRDLALINGELPIRDGIPASVFSELPKILERTGNDDNGSITAIYTVLTKQGQIQDAIKDEVTSLLDGHIVLSPELASKRLFPAISIEESVSRCSSGVTNEAERILAEKVKKIFYQLQDEELLMFGAKASEELKKSLAIKNDLHTLLYQGKKLGLDFIKLKARLEQIVNSSC